MKKFNESGRSMVEMLGVLAIVGVLSIGSFAALKIALNKAKANAIVHDGRLVFMESTARQGEIVAGTWASASYASESGKSFSMMRDVKGNDYVQVEEVEENVCEQMLNMQKDDVLVFLDLTLRPFKVCAQSNVMVFGFDGIGKQIPCETNADCQADSASYNGYCDTEEGYCHECGALELVNNAGTACVCDTTKAVSCSDDQGNSWCCGDDTGSSNLICGGSSGSCVPNPDGKCWYEFTQTITPKPLCHFQLISNDNEGLLEQVENSGCPENQYCYLLFSNPSCGSAGSSATDLYGLCQPMNVTTFDTSCTIGTLNSFEEYQGCPANQYCYIQWQNNSCATAGNNQTGTLYGACLPMDSISAVCPY